MAALPDDDPQETNEWLDALDGLLQHEGPERAHYILEKLIEKARRSGVYLPYSANTPYFNTIPPGKEERSPGDHELEHRIRSYVRWNAARDGVARQQAILGTRRPHRQLRLGRDTLRCRLQSLLARAVARTTAAT